MMKVHKVLRPMPALVFIFLKIVLLTNSAQGEPWGDNAPYFEHWCGKPHALRLLDDAQCAKRFPPRNARQSEAEFRAFQCPAALPSRADLSAGFHREMPLAELVASGRLDSQTLARVCGPAVEAPELSLAVILVQRVRNDGVFFRYLVNHGAQTPAETWSSSKIFAVAKAASVLRSAPCSIGLNSSTLGKHGRTALGDLATVITSYDTTLGYTSNSLAALFGLRIGSISELNDALLHDWLLQSQSLPAQSLGGSYGAHPPPDLDSNNFTSFANGASCHVPVVSQQYVANTLAPLSAAEWLRRLVLHRETQFKQPNMTWDDVQVLLYGANPSTSLFGNALRQGGMSVSTGLFMQAGLPMAAMNNATNGQWRIFSKLGAGYSTSRLRGEILTNAYGCFPVRKGGLEVIVAARASVPHDTSLKKAQAVIERGVSCTVKAAFDGAFEN